MTTIYLAYDNVYNIKKRACLKLYLRNEVFKLKKYFLAKTLFLSFLQKCVFAIFRLFKFLKTLSIFFTKWVLFSSNRFFEC
jgi:hypothetical protein